MNSAFLEEIGGVKTARREAVSLLLAKALLKGNAPSSVDSKQLLKLAKKNKVLLRSADLFGFSTKEVENAKAEAEEAFRLHQEMSEVFERNDISYVAIKSFDSLPDIGHDIDFLVPKQQDMERARELLIGKFGAKPQALTHCDRLVGKFSCFLPGYAHDFELYPTVSQLGEVYLDPEEVLRKRRKESMEGREIWITSNDDRILIRAIHAIFRHNFLKLSDIIDLLKLLDDYTPGQLLHKVDEANISDGFIFYLGCVDRFLNACNVEHSAFRKLKQETMRMFRRDNLEPLRRDRLVLPYRIPNRALFILFLLKASRDAANGRWKSCLRCLVAPVLVVLDFLSAAVRSGGRGMVW